MRGIRRQQLKKLRLGLVYIRVQRARCPCLHGNKRRVCLDRYVQRFFYCLACTLTSMHTLSWLD